MIDSKVSVSVSEQDRQQKETPPQNNHERKKFHFKKKNVQASSRPFSTQKNARKQIQAP
jgi:hypothetical protein